MPTKTASGRSRTKVAKAALISWLVLALRTWICSPMERAAAFQVSQRGHRTRGIGRINDYGHTRDSGHQLTQEFQPLCYQLTRQEIDTRQVAARPSEARDKAKPNRVFGDENTTGIVVVAALAANVAGTPIAAIATTRWRISSAASAGNRSI